jgi:N,N'-diacetyllegionaminate synthase
MVSGNARNEMVKIGERVIGDGNPIFIVFEIGPTHNGFESAKRLIGYAAEAGADAVKFQILSAERLVRDPAMMVEYGYLADRATGLVKRHTEPLVEVLKRRALTRDEWRRLKEYADQLSIAFFATVSFEDELDFLVEIGCASVKLASLDINHLPFMREIAKRDLCIQLDTGNATLGEIEQAVDLLIDAGAQNFIIHHCPSGYPARLESINLRAITTLKQMFDCPIAFSDHTPGWDMDIAAAALGVNLLEKTITEDRSARSPEHVMSLEPPQFQAFVKAVRELEIALGGKRRRLSKVEAERRSKRRRSAYLLEAAPKGVRLQDLKIEYGRPGNGLQPDVAELFMQARLNKPLPAGRMLTVKDFYWEDE